MSVPEQVPYKEYRATGSNNSFEITFYLPDPKDLVVMVNKEIPPVGAYSIQGNTVVFNTPPNEGDLVEIIRDTQLDRETNFKSYNNSFRPETINFDLDKIWLVLQESNLVDAKILARLKQEIEWRRTHDFNYDELAQVREKQQFDALKNYSEMLLASTNPGVFQGVIAGVVFARDGKSIQTHLEEILENLVASREDIDSKADRQYVDGQISLKSNSKDVYQKSETYNRTETYNKTEIDVTFSSFAGGRKAYTTLALAVAAQSTLPADTVIDVTNDPTASNNGTYQWNGTTLTKSEYDPVGQTITHIDNTLDRKMLDVLRPEYTKASKNLLDPSEVIHDCYITTGGAIVYSLGAVTSPKVKVLGETRVAVSGLKQSSSFRAVCYFDKTGKFISAVSIAPQNTQASFSSIPANAYYIQFTIRLAADAAPYDPSLLQLESGGVASSYTPFLKGDLKSLLGSDIYQRDDIEDKINNTLNPVFKVGSKNLFNPSEIIMDKAVLTENGNLETFSGSASSGRINIDGKSIIIAGLKSTTQYKGVCFYDEDGVFIAAQSIAPGLTSKSFSPPVGAVFVQFTIKTHDDPSPLDISTLQVEYGNVATDYEPYAKGDLVSLYGVPIGGSVGSAAISKAFGANYLIFGDSITSTSRVTSGLFDETYYMNWPVYAKDILNMGEFRNYAVSGASFKDRSIEPYQFMGLQIETSIINEETPDVIIVACGTNDGTTDLGTYEQAMGKATLDDLDQTITLEAARHAFWTLRLAYPDAVCFYANPLQRVRNTTEQLAPAVNALGIMAKRYGFNLIDQNNCSGIIRELEVLQGEGKYLRDGLHTNDAGMKKQAEFICSQVISRMMY